MSGRAFLSACVVGALGAVIWSLIKRRVMAQINALLTLVHLEGPRDE